MRARPCLPPCHLVLVQMIPSAASVQLNLYELANHDHHMAYLGQKEGPRLGSLSADTNRTRAKGCTSLFQLTDFHNCAAAQKIRLRNRTRTLGLSIQFLITDHKLLRIGQPRKSLSVPKPT
jgi:hypothetical protein